MFVLKFLSLEFKACTCEHVIHLITPNRKAVLDQYAIYTSQHNVSTVVQIHIACSMMCKALCRQQTVFFFQSKKIEKKKLYIYIYIFRSTF